MPDIFTRETAAKVKPQTFIEAKHREEVISATAKMRLLALDLKSRKANAQTTFSEVISQQARLNSFKLSFSDVITS